jgi:hypothetical protein
MTIVASSPKVLEPGAEVKDTAPAASAVTQTVSSISEGAQSVALAALSTAGSALSAVGHAVPKGLVALDNVLDLVPLGSAASNLVDLGLKHLLIKDMDPNSSAFKEYVEHIQKKKTTECLAYGVPLAGNLYKLGTLVYGFVAGKTQAQAAEESWSFPPSLGEREGMSTLGDRLLQAEGGDELERDPLTLASGGERPLTVDSGIYRDFHAERF